MAKPDQSPEDKKESPEEAAAWGTWEELLLAYAVNRFGTNSWGSISSELRKRSSAPILITPHHCQRKYQELQRRFERSNGGDTGTATDIPWLEELRELRVAELQRQLQNFDDYIASLQSKVKKLTEGSEKDSDLGQTNDEIEIKNEEETNNEPPAPVISGEEQLPGGESMNGSNGNLEIGVEKSENESSPVGTGDDPVRDGRPDRVKSEPEGGTSEAPESMAESKSEGTMKENSDVQSSASKSRKERNDRVRRGSSKADEDHSKDQLPIRSLPLVNIMQKVQKLGSAIFERRLDRQEKTRYKNLIRQHIDFEILETRLKEGRYADGNTKFFRDLLLLVNNTRVFFPTESPESVAAAELRKFITNETTSKRKPKTESKLTEKQNPSKPTTTTTTTTTKRASEPPDSMLLKPKLAGPMIACRKRSSIAAKTSASSSENEAARNATRDAFPSASRKTGKTVRENAGSDVKVDTKKKNKKVANEAEEKKQSAAKFLNRMKQSSPAANGEPLGGGGGSDDEKGGDGKKYQVAKRGVGGRQLKEDDSSPGGGGGSDDDNGGDGRKDQVAKRGGGARQVKEDGSLARRNVGRPPKRGAAPPAAAGVTGKRNREPAESETSASKQTKKRSKR